MYSTLILFLQEVHSYVYLETQLLQRGKEPQSATARSSREKKKQEIGGVFKFVVKQAENSKCQQRYFLFINI